MEENELKRFDCEIDEVEDKVVVKIKDLNLELAFPAYEFRTIVRTFQKGCDTDYVNY